MPLTLAERINGPAVIVMVLVVIALGFATRLGLDPLLEKRATFIFFVPAVVVAAFAGFRLAMIVTLVGAAAELRYGGITPRRPGAVALQPFIFFDAAWMWHESANFAGLDPQKLYSAGGGMRATWANHARIDLTLATPLRKAAFQTERGGTRLLFSMTTQILPWRR